MESILVLEDDENLRSIIADTLGDEGYEVSEAASAEQAIALARQRSFHLILSDVRMAGPLDGVGAIEQIKTFRPNIRSIVLTGYTDQDVPLRAARTQADDYLFKPIGLPQLLDVVRLTLDRENTDFGIMGRMLQAPGEFAQKAMAWAYEGKLQQLTQLRERFLQRFFLLLRANHLNAEDAYPVYQELLEVESRYQSAKPTEWAKLSPSYTALEHHLLAAISHEAQKKPGNPLLKWPQFQRFYRLLQQGEVTAEQFQNSAHLLLDPAFRRANLANYLAHQKIWASPKPVTDLQATDPFLGKTLGEYTLRKLQPGYTDILVYDAMNTSGVKRLVIGFPQESNPQEVLFKELQSQKVLSVGELNQHHFFLLNQKDNTARQHIPPDGLPLTEAWQLMRPIFLQVQGYHDQGICSGDFSLDDIQVLPGLPARLIRFSSDGSMALIRRNRELMQRGTPLWGQAFNFNTQAPSEILFATVEQPIPASDQAVLGSLLGHLILGRHRSRGTNLAFFLTADEVRYPLQSNTVWTHLLPVFQNLGPALYRMAQIQHEQRYPTVVDAIEAIDQALNE